VTEELALVAVLRRERRRSRVPLGEGTFDLLAAPGGPMTRPPHQGPLATLAVVLPHLNKGDVSSQDPRSWAPGTSGAQGGPRPPLGFETVDLTADTEEDEMDTAPATPPPTVSDGEEDDEVETDEEGNLLASPSHNSSDSVDGFQHV